MRSLLLLAVLLGGLLAPAQAQTLWSQPYEPNQIALEALVPEFPNDDVSAWSGATFLTVTRSFNDNIELAAELPVARYAAGGTPATAVGNPYVGIGLSSTTNPILLELGVRIPAVPSNRALKAGRRADIGRTAAFRDEAFSASALLNSRLVVGRRTTLRLRAGPSYASENQPNAEGRTGVWRLLYSAQLWRSGEPLMTGLSVVGRPELTDSPLPERGSTHHAVLSLMLNGERVQPGLLLGTGLDPLFNDGRFQLIGGVTLSISYLR
jgi:hypothetical protein